MAINFPSSPVDGQIYYDYTSGNRYIYKSALSAWKYAANNSLEGVANTQVVFNKDGSFGGSNSVEFYANTLYVSNVFVTNNVTATYYYGNGAFLTGVASDLGAANNWANTIGASGNAYALLIGTAGNNWSNTKTYTYYQNTAPASSISGHDIWVNSNTGMVYENYGNTNYPIWVEFGPTGIAYSSSNSLANVTDISFAGNLYFPSGNIAIGRPNTTVGYALDVVGTINASNVLVNGSPITATGGGTALGLVTATAMGFNLP